MDTTPKISPERTKRQSLAFGRNLIVLGVLALLPGVWGAAKGALTLRWPRAEATIIDADLTRQSLRRSSTPRSTDMWNSFHVHYRYEVGGREYLGGYVEPYDHGMQNSAGAEKMRARHPVGAKAQVAYDPDAPEIAYLEPGPSSFSLALVGIGTVIGLSGLWIRSLARRGIGRMAT
jgi:hypothetical protein